MAQEDEPTPTPRPQSRQRGGGVLDRLRQGDIEAAFSAAGITIDNSGAEQEARVPRVWMPDLRTEVTTHYLSGREERAHGMPSPTPLKVKTLRAHEVTIDRARSFIYNESFRSQILEFLQRQGFQVQSFEELQKIWYTAVSMAADAWANGQGSKVTVFDILESLAPTGAGGPPKGQRWSQTVTETNITEIGPETARAILTNALTEHLGRAPTQEEIEDFASRANAIVSANPQVTETTTTQEWDPELGDYVPTERTTRQIGPSAEEVRNMVQQAAVDEAMESDEYGAFQAATTYFNALLQAIASPTG